MWLNNEEGGGYILIWQMEKHKRLKTNATATATATTKAKGRLSIFFFERINVGATGGFFYNAAVTVLVGSCSIGAQKSEGCAVVSTTAERGVLGAGLELGDSTCSNIPPSRFC